ncbi:unnamed protein product [Ostreobium quekettii]|uniref:Uncharacterized protein n=1 Tax=Ostreobium quekettii TaxID=121088 RepID=A0A8S1J4N0_9CHLO|nr:unnamed protein product [Ostreobium quekettii]
MDADGSPVLEPLLGGRGSQRPKKRGCFRSAWGSAAKFWLATWEFFTFSWINPVLRLGAKKALTTDSALPLLPEGEKMAALAPKFDQAYQRRKATISGDPETMPGMLLSVLLCTHWLALAQQMGWIVGKTTARLMSPFFLRAFLLWLENGDGSDGTSGSGQWNGVVFGVALVTASAVDGLMFHQLWWIGWKLGFRMRQQCMASIHAKVMRLNSSTITRVSTGRVVNLVSNDIGRFDFTAILWQYSWLGPLELVIVLVLVGLEVGFLPAVCGVGAFALMIPMQAVFGRCLGKLRSKSTALTDKRITLIGEVISGTLAVKMLGLEDPFFRKIREVRSQEGNILCRRGMFIGANEGMHFFTTTLAGFVTFAVMWALGRTLRVSSVFFTLSLLYLPDLDMAIFFSLSIERCSELWISLVRISRFLCLPEPSEMIQQTDIPVGAIKIDGVDFSWPSNSAEEGQEQRSQLEEGNRGFKDPSEDSLGSFSGVSMNTETPTLRQVRLSVCPGELIGIAGAVGAGKSSLLAALLGEMQDGAGGSGRAELAGSVAFCDQVPWILAGTVRENILFGATFNEADFWNVVDACCLSPDFQQLPAREMTQLGDQGVNLSGGQKARVALARAAYSRADIQLLDDPLSAVDPHVAQELFDKCIGPGGLMEGSTRLLVTHQRQFLPLCDRVIVLRCGEIVANGPWRDLQNQGFDELKSTTDLQQLAHPQRTLSIEETLESVGGDMETDGNNGRARIPGNGDQRESMDDRQDSEKCQERAESAAGKAGDVHMNKDEPAKDSVKSGTLVVEEDQEVGVVSWSVYWRFVVHIGVALTAIYVLIVAFKEILYLAPNLLLTRWASVDAEDQRDSRWVVTYGALVASMMAVGLFVGLTEFVAQVHASTRLHNAMAARVLRAPLSFFHTNPVGRVLNRFSKDQDLVDEELPITVSDIVAITMEAIGSLVLVAAAVPPVAVVEGLVLIGFWRLRKHYIMTAREAQREVAVTSSPIFAAFSETLKGLSTIRAYGLKNQFEATFMGLNDHNGSWWYTKMAANRWLGVRLDMSSTLVLAAAVSFTLATREKVDPGLLGLALTYVLQLTGILQYLVSQTATLETEMTSVERMLHYTTLDQEPPRVADGGGRPPTGWLSSGSIAYQGVTASYRPGLDPVLRDLTFKIPGGSSVGIVGRTGSGKSSLMLTLYRLIDINGGQILFDGVDTSKLGIDAVRDQVAIIPQDPVLFSGSLRSNLDPWDRYTDARVWEVLSTVRLTSTVQSAGGLYSSVTECGGNFSAGQRQLMCLARALLKDARILALDEATANVDQDTDALIQAALSSCRGGAQGRRTLLIIAHRVDTVIDCDHLLVLDHGHLIEQGAPRDLLQENGSVFSRMVGAARGAWVASSSRDTTA